MNLNELFFFKVFPCKNYTSKNLNLSTHNEQNCYFYHISTIYNNNGDKKILEKDRRREPIQFSEFFKKLIFKLKEDNNYSLSIDTIFELKNNENSFNYYDDSIPFDYINEYIYSNGCCYNETEFNYHMKRYKKNICRFLKINKKCKNKFCYSKHINNEIKNNENNKENNNINIINNDINCSNNIDINEGIIQFRNLLNKWEEKKELQFKEIIDLYNYILSFENKYLSNIQLHQIKDYFIIFQKWYEEIKTEQKKNESKLNDNNLNSFHNEEKNNQNNIQKRAEKFINYQILQKYQGNQNDSNEQIINNFFKSINIHNNSATIYKNSKMIESLKINTNVCYISKYTNIKKAEIIKYVYAMLNSSDGVIVYGGHENNNIIKGISLNRKERDKFKIWFNSEFIKILIAYEDNLQYNFYDLANNSNDECVLVIRIKKIKSHKFVIKFPDKCLIIKEKFLNKNKYEKNKLLNEENIKELDLREYLEILRKKLLEHYSHKFKVKI